MPAPLVTERMDFGIMSSKSLGATLTDPANRILATTFNLPCKVSRISISYDDTDSRTTVVSILDGMERFEIFRNTGTQSKFEIRDNAFLSTGQEVEVSTTDTTGSWSVEVIASYGNNS